MSNKLASEALKIIKNGGVVCFPTDTVFALACDATNDDAVKKIYEIKNRDYSKPLAIFVKDLNGLKDITQPNKFLENFYDQILSGKLTVVLKPLKKARLSKFINTKNDTIGIRIPKHELTQEILEEFKKPLAATSLNISGEKEITNSLEISEDLRKKIDFIIDGESDNKLVSTIVDLTSDTPKILRHGAIKLDLAKSI